jgi:5-methylcytosine-specific restriction endonuclease McrA
VGDHVLVLNATYEPLSTVGWQRAVVLVLEGIAEAVAVDEVRRVRSPSISIARPHVIRLLSYVRVPRGRRTPVTRRGVLARDGHRCGYCRGRADTVDHVVPRSRPGGAHSWANLVAACRTCNGRKGNRTPDEADMPLLVQPFEPLGVGAVLLRAGTLRRAEWEPWLTRSVAS